MSHIDKNNYNDWGQFVYIDGHMLERTNRTPPPFFPLDMTEHHHQLVTTTCSSKKTMFVFSFTPHGLMDVVSKCKPIFAFVCWIPAFVMSSINLITPSNCSNKNKRVY